MKIEEADVRMIPLARHSVNRGASRDILLSNDIDVMILGLHCWSLFHLHGIKEVWIIAGIGNSIRHIPLYTLAKKMDPEMLQIHTATPSPHCL